MGLNFIETEGENVDITPERLEELLNADDKLTVTYFVLN